MIQNRGIKGYHLNDFGSLNKKTEKEKREPSCIRLVIGNEDLKQFNLIIPELATIGFIFIVCLIYLNALQFIISIKCPLSTNCGQVFQK